jgi:hypothetical protein
MISITLELDEALYWRLYCKAVEQGASVPEEILAQLRGSHTDSVPDAEARLAEAREIRALAQEKSA